MIAGLEEAAVLIAVLTPLELTFEVVIAGRAFLIAISLAAMPDDFVHPPFLGLRRRVDRLDAVAARVLDARCYVIALGLQHVGQVELKRRVVAAHDEEIRLSRRMDSRPGAYAFAILVVELEAVLAFDLIVDAGLLHF